MTLGDRIKAVRGPLSRDKFAPQTGISKTALVNYETNERTPPSDYLVKILEQFPSINPAWLLMGEGEMYRNGRRTLASGIFLDEFAKRIKTIRGDIPIADFANSLDISEEDAIALEAGKLEPGYGFLSYLCFEYDISYSWLFDGTGLMKYVNGKGLSDELFVRVVQSAILTFQETNDDRDVEARKQAAMAFDIMALIGELRDDLPEYIEINNIFTSFIKFYKTLIGGEIKEADLPKIVEQMILRSAKRGGH